MSAAEIIEQIKALPLEEQREVSRFVRTRLDATQNHSAEEAASEPIESIAARLFDRYDPLFRKLAE
ncbi:MAG: hypothetical protein WDN28_31370 [Chthoniobacter sp.]